MRDGCPKSMMQDYYHTVTNIQPVRVPVPEPMPAHAPIIHTIHHTYHVPSPPQYVHVQVPGQTKRNLNSNLEILGFLDPQIDREVDPHEECILYIKPVPIYLETTIHTAHQLPLMASVS